MVPQHLPEAPVIQLTLLDSTRSSPYEHPPYCWVTTGNSSSDGAPAGVRLHTKLPLFAQPCPVPAAAVSPPGSNWRCSSCSSRRPLAAMDVILRPNQPGSSNATVKPRQEVAKTGCSSLLQSGARLPLPPLYFGLKCLVQSTESLVWEGNLADALHCWAVLAGRAGKGEGHSALHWVHKRAQLYYKDWKEKKGIKRKSVHREIANVSTRQHSSAELNTTSRFSGILLVPWLLFWYLQK